MCRVASLAPDPIAIGRALADRPGLAVLASGTQGAPRPDDARWSFVACDPVEDSNALIPPADDCIAIGYGGAREAPRWIGVLPYEALRSLERRAWTLAPDERPNCTIDRPVWRRYDAVVRIDHHTGEVVVEGDDAAAIARLARAIECPSASGTFILQTLPPEETDDAHRARVSEALRLIAAGDLYEVNLSRRIPLVFQGDKVSLFEAILAAAPAPWGFLQDLGSSVVCGVSPELALSVRGEALRTCPIKGTRPRGKDASQDARLALSLATDPKELAELTMAVDVHRNDLGRVAVPGSVRVAGEARVLSGRTVWSRVAEVVARRLPGMSLTEVARALLPCGSVTGAPKVRAMEAIARLEPWRRGAYTGAFGYVGRAGSLELAVAIRTLQIDDGASGPHDSQPKTEGRRAERPAFYFAGGGIVADSIPDVELEETRWKAMHIEGLGRLRPHPACTARTP